MNSQTSRTQRQNRSGHKYFTMVSDTLNDAGLEQRTVLSRVAYDIPNTPASIKGIFREIANKMFGISSTTELTTKQWSEVEQVFTRELQEKLGIELPEYPSEESLMYKNKGFRRVK